MCQSVPEIINHSTALHIFKACSTAKCTLTTELVIRVRGYTCHYGNDSLRSHGDIKRDWDVFPIRHLFTTYSTVQSPSDITGKFNVQ